MPLRSTQKQSAARRRRSAGGGSSATVKRTFGDVKPPLNRVVVNKRQDTVCLKNLSDGVMVIMVSGFSLLDIKINNNKNIACWVRILK